MTCEYLREFSKKFETVLMEYSGAGGKLMYEKNRSKKIGDTVPLSKPMRTLLWYSSLFPIFAFLLYIYCIACLQKESECHRLLKNGVLMSFSGTHMSVNVC